MPPCLRKCEKWHDMACFLERVLFWACHPFNIVPTLPGIRKLMSSHLTLTKIIYKFFLRKYCNICLNFLKILKKNNAIIFMDKENTENIEHYLSTQIVNPKFVPVGTYLNNNFKIHPQPNNQVINILWLGRIVDFKFYALKKFLVDLSIYQKKTQTKVCVKIIGTGDYAAEIQKVARRSTNLDFQFFEDIDINELESHLSHTHLCVAMGTSAIDCAKFGVPTILIDFHYNEFPKNYKYKFLHEQKGYVLGRSLSRKRSEGRELPELIHQALNSRDELGALTHKYLMTSHDIQVTVSYLINAISRSTLRFIDVSTFKASKTYKMYTALTIVRSLIKKCK